MSGNENSPEKDVSEKPELAFSFYNPMAPSQAKGKEDNAVIDTGPKKKRSPVWIFTWIVIAVAIILVPTVYFVYGPKKKTKKAVEVQEQAAKDSPEQAYEKLSVRIDDLLSTPGSDDNNLYSLAKERYDLALQMQDAEKICKSADFAAAIADRIKNAPEAVKFYDTHNLFNPEQKILEAKFLLCQRYKIPPANSAVESDLYRIFLQLKTTGDELATDLSPPLNNIDDYMKVMRYYNEQRAKYDKMNASKSTYTYLLKLWIWEEKELNLLCKIAARQKHIQNFLDLSILQSRIPGEGLCKLTLPAEFEESKVFQKYQLSAIDGSPDGSKIYMDPENKLLIVLGLDKQDEITDYKLISLTAAAGGQCDDAIMELLVPAVYGKYADEFPEAIGILKSRMTLANFRAADRSGSSQVYTLVDRAGNLLGFELNQKHSGDKIESKSDNVYALIPKERLGSRKLQAAVRMQAPPEAESQQNRASDN